METRNLDFEIPLTRPQWEQVGRRAAALGPAEGGYDWREAEPDRVLLRDEDVSDSDFWSRFVSGEGTYGRPEREVAQFVWNDGRPYAHLEDLPQIEEPALTGPQEDAAERALEAWVRDRWHALMRESGLHYERGHVPTDLPQPE